MELKDAVQEITGYTDYSLKRLKGGGAANTFCLTLPDKSELVLKGKGRSLDLKVEAKMLDFLIEKTDLPVPKVKVVTEDFLIVEKLNGLSGSLKVAEADLAYHLRSLHANSQESYGFDYNTPYSRAWAFNSPKSNWIDFFRENRLLHALRLVVDHDRIPSHFVPRIEDVANNLDRWIVEPDKPSLLHGDLWHGNVLTIRDRLTGLIDPAIFYGAAEFEFAPATWKRDLKKNFFEIYFSDQGGIPDGFEIRQRVYQIFPILTSLLVSNRSRTIRLENILKGLGV